MEKITLEGSDRMRGDGLKLHQGTFVLDTGGASWKEWLGTGTAAHGVVGSLSLEVLQNWRDVALRDVVMGSVGCVGDLGGLFQP